MRLSIVRLAIMPSIIFLQGFCYAQYRGLPICAVSRLSKRRGSYCTENAFQERVALIALEATGCHIPDFQCICSNQTYIDSLEPAFEANCDPPDVTSKQRKKGLSLKLSYGLIRCTVICLEHL
jgi:hypothetical protein